jgi:intracellular septation protein A
MNDIGDKKFNWRIAGYLAAAAISATAVVTAGIIDDWQSFAEYGVLTIALLLLASKTEQIDMLQRALRKAMRKIDEADA